MLLIVVISVPFDTDFHFERAGGGKESTCVGEINSLPEHNFGFLLFVCQGFWVVEPFSA